MTITAEEQTKKNTYPIVKWAGGKRQLISEILKNKPKNFKQYFEPFVGGGSLFFSLQADKAYISDINEELINLYNIVRNNADELIEDLKKHEINKEYFLEIRAADRGESYKKWSNVEKASRFIYLNRTCFNGLYRVNSKGYFNVPYGNYVNPRIVDEANLHNCSCLLKKAQIECSSFTSIVKKVQKNDFVYLDPPYLPLHGKPSFTSYTKEGFDIKMHKELKNVCDYINSIGAYFLLSNSNTILIKELYADYEIKQVMASRQINATVSGRTKIPEILVKNY